MTSLAFVEQAAAVESALGRVKEEHMDTVREAGLEPLLRRIAKLNEKYRTVLHLQESKATSPGLDFGTVRASRAAAQDYLLQVVAMVLGRFPSPSAQDQKARTQLLTPVLTQNEQDPVGAPEPHPADGCRPCQRRSGRRHVGRGGSHGGRSERAHDDTLT